MATYTRYCLTDAMLRRLSAIVNGNLHGLTGGVSATALQRRELVTFNLAWKPGDPAWLPTDAGKRALEEARREGW